MKNLLTHLMKIAAITVFATNSLTATAGIQYDRYVTAQVVYANKVWRLAETPQRNACSKAVRNEPFTVDPSAQSVLIGYDRSGQRISQQVIVNPRFIIGEKDLEPGSIQYGHDDQLNHIGLAPSIKDNLIIADYKGTLTKVELWEQEGDMSPVLTIDLSNVPVNTNVVCNRPYFSNEGKGGGRQ